MRTNISSRVFLLVVVAALACQLSAAQTLQQSVSRQAANRKDFLAQQNALQTLLYLRNSALEIGSPRDRVRVLLEVADALWLLDKEAAREVFKQSFAQAAEFDNSIPVTELRPRPSTALQQTVVTRLAKRDPALARSLLRSTAEQPTRAGDAFGELYGASGGQNEILMKAAEETLSSDPKQASEIARLASADGLSQQMRLLLLSLRAKDKAAADALFGLTLQNATVRRPKQLVEALFLWDYAFQRKTIYLGSVAWFREASVEYPVPGELKQKALSFAIDAVIENAQQSYLASASETERPLILERYALIHSVASQILPDVQALIPSASPSLLSALDRLNHELREQGRAQPAPPEPLPQSQTAQTGIDKLIERAGKAPTIAARDGLYAKAALRLYLGGDYERAVEVARSIDDPSLRLKVSEPIRFDWAGFLIERNDLDAATSVIHAVVSIELRVALLARLASASFTPNGPSASITILNEAEALFSKGKPSPYLASAMLGIGQVYLKINDRNQALASTSLAIGLVNALDEGGEWDLLGGSGGAAGRLSIQDIQWTNRKDGGLESLTVVYPRLAGLLDLLPIVLDVDLDEGLMLARQLKPKGLNYAVQAAMCRQTIQRLHVSQMAPDKTTTARKSLH